MKLKRLVLYPLTTLLLMIVSGCATQIPLETPRINQASFLKSSHKDLHTNRNEVFTLTCKPLMLFEVQLPPSETVLSINSGDTARWSFQTIVSHTDENPITHILIKPKEDNIKTNMVIATNQGLIKINLISNEQTTTPVTTKFIVAPHPIGNFCQKIDTRYEAKMSHFQKAPSWLPRSIYNDGKSVFITMPKLNRDAAPIFYVLNEDNQPTIVNYQVENNTYRIDQLFSKGILIKGVGRMQQKIRIDYLGDLL